LLTYVRSATDVYALGVLLYELVTGRSPFRIETTSPPEIARIICEQEPIRPSTASRTSASLAPLEARTLRGDLDNIVLKAMRKEPQRRYASVAAFSEDVLRYLRGYPVDAASGAWRYQAGKFIGRHRAAVIPASAVALALVAFGIEMGLLAQRATRERLRAQREEQFLAGIFQAATPEHVRGQEVTARELLDQGAQRADRELAGAERYARQALEMRRKLGGEEHPDVASSLIDVGVDRWFEGDPAGAEPLLREALKIREAKLEPGHPDTLEAQVRLGEVLTAEGKAAEAEPLLRQAVQSAHHPPFPLVPWQVAEAETAL
jgi:eukaryotic-like serine/threonine-protein kinase